ncbi:MAG: gfo/Idh/MocA family oxidoreductase, partial [Pseudomonadota bacterium]
MADLGSHILASAEFLLVPITKVMGHCATLIDQRMDGTNQPRAVTTDDITNIHCHFACGAIGNIQANWIA